VIELDNVTAYYGRSQVLHGIDLQVRRGETVAVLGRNGVGKTTTLKSILGLVDRRGRITIEGHDITRSSAHAIPRSGIQLVPENRGIFAAVTVEENLRLASTAGAAWSVERVLDTFPGWPSAELTTGTGCPAASSRCWPSPGPWSPDRS